MAISIHKVELQIKILDELKPDEAFHFLTIPAGAIITRPFTQVGDLLVLEYTTDYGKPTECAVEIGVSDDLQYARCDSDPYLLDTAEKVEWANKVSAPMKWVLGDHCYYKPGKVAFK